jgi:fimbrial chaperone protein
MGLGKSGARTALAAAIVLCIALPVFAQEEVRSGGVGGLLVAPTRIVLGPRDRVGELTLVNHGAEPTTFRIDLVNKRMTERGDLVEISAEEAGSASAAPLLRYAPRQVTLQPEETQVVRLLARRPADLAEGEYRAHLLIRPEPPAPDVTNESRPEASRLSVGITATPALSIPVIIRQGQTHVSVSLTELALVPRSQGRPGGKLGLRINREGNQSAYGDMTVTYVPPDGGEERVVGTLLGVAVYTPNATRLLELPVDGSAGALTGGQLHVYYRTPAPDGDTLLAEAELALR